MRIKSGAIVLMELGPRRRTIEYTLRRLGFALDPVTVRIQDPFGSLHEADHVSDFLVFPKMEDLKDTFVKSRVPKIFTGAVNIRQPGPGSGSTACVLVAERLAGAINWSAYAQSGLVVSRRAPTPWADVILIVDGRAVAETGPVSRNALVYSTRAAASLAKYFLGRRDSVDLITYGDEVVSVDRDPGRSGSTSS